MKNRAVEGNLGIAHVFTFLHGAPEPYHEDEYAQFYKYNQ